MLNDYEEDYEEVEEEDYSEAIRIIMGYLFMCVAELKNAGYSSKDFEDIMEY